MLLRRITHHVKTQNWFAVFIDFLIVVAGILIALQITNWHELRIDRQSEAGYLKNLIDDISEEIVAFDEVEYGLKTTLSVTEKMFNDALQENLSKEVKMASSAKAYASDGNWSVPALVDVESKDHEYFLSHAIFTRVFNENNSTFETLKSTGDIRVISDKGMANAIADYYANIENIIYFENGTVRNLRDLAATLAIRNGLNPYGRNQYISVVESIKNDKEFAASLRSLRNIKVLNYQVISATKTEAQSLIGVLEENLQ